MKFDKLDQLTLLERREFLKYVTAFMALPIISESTRNAMAEVLLGSPAHAQAVGPVNFIEICFRDQWDFQCLFMPPGVAAQYANAQNRLPPAGMPIQERRNFFVTANAAELRPHLDDIAVMELGQICVGSVHAHEAANPLRSPGRSYTGGAGRLDMSTVDKRPGGRVEGNEVYYSSTPTPAILHNYYSKMQTPGLTNGVILRSTLRADIHTYYHFEANLANAQADRFFDKDTFLNKFAGTTIPPTSSSSAKYGSLVAQFIKRLDDAHLQRALANAERAKQGANADALSTMFGGVSPTPISLTLSAAEEAMWKTGIGPQVICPGDDANQCVAQGNKWHPSELFAYAGKLLQSGKVRTVAIDFDLSDVHTNRTKFMMDTQAQQSGMTLARLINFLKANNMWSNTVIAMYTLDGSRSMDTNSTGQDSKNAIVLAGGKINGGYYGDIRYNNGNFIYHRPDDAGLPVATGVTDGSQRVPAADVYKTVMAAAGIPMTVLDGFTDVKAGKVLQYMLK